MQVYDSSHITGKAEKEFQMETYTGKSELDKADFLTLLVAQLQHQDPMSPMDDQQFTAELAQFSQLEQLTQINEGIGGLSQTTAQQQMVNAASYIGKDVRAVGDSLSIHDDGSVSSLYYLLADNASNVFANIFDSNGNIVRTVEMGAQATGEHEYEWDGKDWKGDKLSEGTYYVALAAEDQEGSPILTQTEVSGRVEGVMYDGGVHYLRLEDGRVVAFNYVKEVVASNGTTSEEGDSSSGEEESTTE
ncbi:flagellar hook assembly protein FlgD [Desulfovibrio ferrophilus]|uniref:Basal-body rod modification protein FlgD n=1 Tax=Desulfovibrio ferrophilus TaxID=241368 RepID=A0A2Z6B0D6_9BACT|nr:flagellar hook assembly protein FlgD [Desulfovibrio ferrophilus]BBD08900.1 flagellar hook capping protein [Desulfovibrio ferrophilus]